MFKTPPKWNIQKEIVITPSKTNYFKKQMKTLSEKWWNNLSPYTKVISYIYSTLKEQESSQNSVKKKIKEMTKQNINILW